MADTVSSYRIRTDVGQSSASDYITIDANLVQEYDTLDILSVKIRSNDTYRLHNADYGVVVGRVIANNGFGIPNAKLSIFIASDGEDGEKVRTLYPFTSSASKNSDGVRYNLLPDEKVGDCHQIVGTFPNKRYALDNDVILEVFDKYYKYTTRSNNAGDFLIMGVPTGSHTLHMDLDLSDCGILSQRPRDFVYKGYTVEQFENPNMFKSGTTYQNLSQIFTQDRTVNVKPLWGNSSLGEELGITRADIDVAFVFETTCVFMGSVISDNSSQGITKKCMGTENMGNMEEMVTGEGTIEMIRKTPAGNVEEFQVKGTQLIDADGVWCYQIPMNLDYMMTDEYGNMVPTDDPSKGVATRARVRFRMSMSDTEENVDNYFRAKALVPHNPQLLSDGTHEDYDYEFGTYTREDSYRDLFWNNVYSVKSYIPRFQKRKVLGWKDKRFVAIKNCNFHGTNNPMPYNNIRIKLPFMFGVMCVIVKCLIWIIGLWNLILAWVTDALTSLGQGLCYDLGSWWGGIGRRLYETPCKFTFSILQEGMCPDLDNWYFAPMLGWHYYVADDIKKNGKHRGWTHPDLLEQTLDGIMKQNGYPGNGSLQQDEDDEPATGALTDNTSVDHLNKAEYEDTVCLTVDIDYLISCIEMNLAMEYRVINFDFYNDWVNGTIYFPRFMRFIKPKLRFLGITWRQAKTKGCMDDPSVFSKTRRYTQQCAVGYEFENVGNRSIISRVRKPTGKAKNEANRLHKGAGFSQITIFGSRGGICHEQETLRGQNVYYMKPCEFRGDTGYEKKINLFATDIILLGSLNDCDRNGIPQAFKYLSSTSYVLPTNLALTNMEENGMLYATEGHTICRGSATSMGADKIEDNKKPQEKIEIVPQNDGLTGEITYFSGGGADVNLEYDAYELSDLIALTEAAGISWNYTGPGQGTPDDEKMYTPGGHFLGLSCVNSQSNIKSCINLTRICEMGANMSQRKEDVFDMDEHGNLKYKYTAPSGFISGNDIVGEDFRSMFATMNHRRLLATRTDPETGYKVYDFDFVHPINFNGAFTGLVNVSDSPYNQTIEVPREDSDVFEEMGISTGSGNGRADYDAEETNNTQIRTVESPDVDYYMFRMGLEYEDLTKRSNRHLKRFLGSDSVAMNLTTGTRYYVPQYENSYYFYFGLNVGATAIEKFNEQFFSVCATEELVTTNKTINLSVEGEINACSASCDVRVVTNNMVAPYERILYYREGAVSGMTVDGATEEGREWLNLYVFTIENLELGTWIVEITDSEGTTVSSSINLIEDFVSFEAETYDFLVNDDSPYLNNDDLPLSLRGGYVELRNVEVKGLPSGTNVYAMVINENGVGEGGIIPVMGDFGRRSAQLKVNSANTLYNIRIGYSCNEEDYITFDIYSFRLKDGSSLNMYIGDRNGAHIYLDERFYEDKWWFKPGNFSDEELWVIWYNLFRRTLDPNEETSSNVSVEKGVKMLWGTPQNPDGFLNEGTAAWPLYQTHNTEQYDMIPEGYALDDDMIYHATLNYRPADYAEGKPVHFGAVACQGLMVLGTYGAVFSGGSITYVNGGRSWFGNRYGWVFRPIEGGENLQFGNYNGNFVGFTDDNERITSGVFYPVYKYPIFNRPFYVCFHYFSLYCLYGKMRKYAANFLLEVHNSLVYKEKSNITATYYNMTNTRNSIHHDIPINGLNTSGADIDTVTYCTVDFGAEYNSNLGTSGVTFPGTVEATFVEGYPDGDIYRQYEAEMMHTDVTDADFPLTIYSIDIPSNGSMRRLYYPVFPLLWGREVSDDFNYYMWEDVVNGVGDSFLSYSSDDSTSNGYKDYFMEKYGQETPFPSNGQWIGFQCVGDNGKSGIVDVATMSKGGGAYYAAFKDKDIYGRNEYIPYDTTIFYEEYFKDCVFDEGAAAGWISFIGAFTKAYPEYTWVPEYSFDSTKPSLKVPDKDSVSEIEKRKVFNMKANRPVAEIINGDIKRFILIEYISSTNGAERTTIHHLTDIDMAVSQTSEELGMANGGQFWGTYPRILDTVIRCGEQAPFGIGRDGAEIAPIVIMTTWWSNGLDEYACAIPDSSWITIDSIRPTDDEYYRAKFTGKTGPFLVDEGHTFIGCVDIIIKVSANNTGRRREGNVRFYKRGDRRFFDGNEIRIIQWE